MNPSRDDPPFDNLPTFDEAILREVTRSAGLKRLSPTWAKIEIVGGLAAAVAGLKLLMGEGSVALAGGALIVLGLYLALAGHRSHLYQSQNRQTAYLARLLLSRRENEKP
jgi:hypothetical protein